MKKNYRIKSWIPAEIEEERLMTIVEAEIELEHLIELQPENKYEIEEVTVEGE